MRVCARCGDVHMRGNCPQVARDARLRDEDLAQSRREAEQRDARRNQPITRGEILDALETALDNARAVGGRDVIDALRLIREAFE